MKLNKQDRVKLEKRISFVREMARNEIGQPKVTKKFRDFSKYNRKDKYKKTFQTDF